VSIISTVEKAVDILGGPKTMESLSLKIPKTEWNWPPAYFRPDKSYNHLLLLNHRVSKVCKAHCHKIEWTGGKGRLAFSSKEYKMHAVATGRYDDGTLGLTATKLAVAVWKYYHETQSIHSDGG